MENKELKKEIVALTLSIQKANSIWWSLLRGIFYGFGVFVGSAILVGALIVVLGQIEGWAYIGRYAHKIMDLIQQSSTK